MQAHMHALLCDVPHARPCSLPCTHAAAIHVHFYFCKRTKSAIWHAGTYTHVYLFAFLSVSVSQTHVETA